jgi:hypothetical protein
MNGDAATKDSDVVPTFVHDPLTGGSNVGIPDGPATGNDRRTVTTWSDGTSVAPVDGTVDTTASVLLARAPVAAPLGARPGRRAAWLCLPITYAPAATARRTTTIETTQGKRRRRGGGTSIW